MGRLSKKTHNSLSVKEPESLENTKGLFKTESVSPQLNKDTPMSRSSIRKTDREGGKKSVSRAVSFSQDESELDSPLKLTEKVKDLKLELQPSPDIQHVTQAKKKEEDFFSLKAKPLPIKESEPSPI